MLVNDGNKCETGIITSISPDQYVIPVDIQYIPNIQSLKLDTVSELAGIC